MMSFLFFILALCLSPSTAFISVRRRFGYFPTARTETRQDGTPSLWASKVGFVGCGTIASAIATGLATSTTKDGEKLVETVAVSRRSQAKSKALAEQFPDLVTIYDNNQDILDNSDIIFITVLPEQTSEILQSLSFDSTRHDLVSLVVRPRYRYCRLF